MEYSGEGGEGVDRACSQWNTGEFSWCKAELDCKCQDTFNNTYTCLRCLANMIFIEVHLYVHLSRSFTLAGESVFCQFEDDENFEEYYDLGSDPWQLTNLAQSLDEEILSKERDMLAGLAMCKGKDCQKYNFDPTTTTTTTTTHSGASKLNHNFILVILFFFAGHLSFNKE